MLATDVKMQKKEAGLIFFCDGRKFRRQCVNMIDNVRLYLFFNMLNFCTLCAKTSSLLIADPVSNSESMGSRLRKTCNRTELRLEGIKLRLLGIVFVTLYSNNYYFWIILRGRCRC